MSRWSGEATATTRSRGQLPLVALVAVATVCLALSLYAGVLADAAVFDRSTDDRTATVAADRAAAALAPDGIAVPARLSAAVAAIDGPRARLTLRVEDIVRRAGPTPPASATPAVATVPVSVRLAPGRVHPGRLTVEVWS